MRSWIATHLWLFPAVPLAVSLVILALSRTFRKSAAALAIIGQIFALALALLALVQTLQTPGFRAVQKFTWFKFGEQTLRVGFVLDPLASAMPVRFALGALGSFIC